MAGTLYLVATPIGNLEDVTHRALRTLREVQLVAAEDTRRTGRLLRHFGISTPMLSLHGHNEHRRAASVLARLQAGDDVALVSDAGTPVVSDPGAGLVGQAVEAGVTVTPVPGPSAVLAALVGSGLPAEEFTFVGFPPSRASDRARWLEGLADEPRTLIFFEAPHRIRQTLEEVERFLGDRRAAIARELTKVHEEWVRGPISEVRQKLGTPRGEFTIVLEGAWEDQGLRAGLPEDPVVAEMFGRLTESGRLNRRAALTSLARRYGVSTREVFASLERSRK